MKNGRGKILALVGAQLGSEGKGVVAHRLASEFNICVRTGAPNAGHSLVHEGKLYKMQSLPCAWVNPECTLVLGAGALINVKILMREIEMVGQVFPDIKSRILIDAAAGILEERHHEEEGGVHGEMHKRMGSTGEGVGPARMDRIRRDPSRFRMARDVEEFRGMVVENVSGFLTRAVSEGHNVLLEGTQGSGLSLIHGAWPHVTSSDTNAAQMAADAGVPPHWVTETMLVARTYPIRVAGPSGPLHNELSWDEMSVRVGRKVVEFTTVTKKQRRIGEWDEQMFRHAVELNDPATVAITFMDYLDPQSQGATKFEQLGPKALDFIHYLERTFRVRVGFIGTGWSETEGWTHIDRR